MTDTTRTPDIPYPVEPLPVRYLAYYSDVVAIKYLEAVVLKLRQKKIECIELDDLAMKLKDYKHLVKMKLKPRTSLYTMLLIAEHLQEQTGVIVGLGTRFNFQFKQDRDHVTQQLNHHLSTLKFAMNTLNGKGKLNTPYRNKVRQWYQIDVSTEDGMKQALLLKKQLRSLLYWVYNL